MHLHFTTRAEGKLVFFFPLNQFQPCTDSYLWVISMNEKHTGTDDISLLQFLFLLMSHYLPFKGIFRCKFKSWSNTP